jgi:hypothetical protein
LSFTFTPGTILNVTTVLWPPNLGFTNAQPPTFQYGVPYANQGPGSTITVTVTLATASLPIVPLIPPPAPQPAPAPPPTSTGQYCVKLSASGASASLNGLNVPVTQTTSTPGILNFPNITQINYAGPLPPLQTLNGLAIPNPVLYISATPTYGIFHIQIYGVDTSGTAQTASGDVNTVGGPTGTGTFSLLLSAGNIVSPGATSVAGPVSGTIDLGPCPAPTATTPPPTMPPTTTPCNCAPEATCNYQGTIELPCCDCNWNMGSPCLLHEPNNNPLTVGTIYWARFWKMDDTTKLPIFITQEVNPPAAPTTPAPTPAPAVTSGQNIAAQNVRLLGWYIS